MSAPSSESERVISLLYRIDAAVRKRILEHDMSYDGPVEVVIRHPDHHSLHFVVKWTEAWRGFNGARDYFRVNELRDDEAELITVHLTFPKQEDEVYHSCNID